jgi:hypothetical protein
MLAAMKDWATPGIEPDFYSSGTGTSLSERTSKPEENNQENDPEAAVDTGVGVGTTGDAEDGEHSIHKSLANAVGPELVRENPKKLRGKVPEDLREILNEVGNQRIISWLPHGKAFKIHNRTEFIEKILPQYYKSTKFSYFADIIRCWGFVRLKQSKRDKGAYYHKLFVRDNPRLTTHLPRQQMKKVMSDWPPDGKEPDLYEGLNITDVEKSQVRKTKKAKAGGKKRKLGHSMSPLPRGSKSADKEKSRAKQPRTENFKEREKEPSITGGVVEV